MLNVLFYMVSLAVVVLIRQQSQTNGAADVRIHDASRERFLLPMFSAIVSAYRWSHGVVNFCASSMSFWCDTFDDKIRTHIMCRIVHVCLESGASMSNSTKMSGDNMDILVAHLYRRWWAVAYEVVTMMPRQQRFEGLLGRNNKIQNDTKICLFPYLIVFFFIRIFVLEILTYDRSQIDATKILNIIYNLHLLQYIYLYI